MFCISFLLHSFNFQEKIRNFVLTFTSQVTSFYYVKNLFITCMVIELDGYRTMIIDKVFKRKVLGLNIQQQNTCDQAVRKFHIDKSRLTYKKFRRFITLLRPLIFPVRVERDDRSSRAFRAILKGGHTRCDLDTGCPLFHVDGAAVPIRGYQRLSFVAVLIFNLLVLTAISTNG